MQRNVPLTLPMVSRIIRVQVPELEYFQEGNDMIAEKLAELRIAKGVTQEDVAQSLSVSNKTISKWENGTSVPDLTMLVELSKYYGVTADSLLGLSGEKKQNTKEEIISLLSGLTCRESVIKAFEMARSVAVAVSGAISGEDISHEASDDGMESVYPSDMSGSYRNMIAHRSFFQFDASSENVNIAVMMLGNKADFAWMNDPDKQKHIVRLFRFLSNEDVISVMHFIHSSSCSDNFTADYIARNTGVSEERASEILDEFCAVGDCRWVMAHLTEGEAKVYECLGDGMILSLITLAFEWMCGTKAYDYCYVEKCKMIGGETK